MTMETQKKYHDLVLIDENNETKQLVIKKLVLIFLLFFIGVVVGAFLISLLHNKNKLTAQIIPIKKVSMGSSQRKTPPISSELQSITALVPSETEGCSIESLGRNIKEGCFVDEYSEKPALKSDNKKIGVTNLDKLTTSISATTKSSDMTNILDLQ